MKSYHGNNRPYIYAVSSKSELSGDVLHSIEEKNIAICLSGNFNSKEKRYIQAAYGILLFLNRSVINDPDLRKIVETAVASNKNIVCIYEEEVKLDSALSMQLNSQQAIFAYRYDDSRQLQDQIMKAQIFADMKITPEQKRSQRIRSFAMIIIPIISAIIIYTTLIYPLLIVPARKQEALKEQFGLAGLSDEDLARITSLQIVGSKVFANPEEINKVSTYSQEDDYPNVIFYDVELINSGKWIWGESGETEKGTIEDLSILYKMPNLERLTIAGENISDVTPIGSLLKLKELVINDNPIESLDGLENCKSLRRIEMRGTLVSDLSPLYKLSNIEGMWIGNCRNVTDLSGFENTTMNNLEIYRTGVTEIRLPKRMNFGLNLSDQDAIRDYSFLNDPVDYDWLILGADIDLIKPHLKNISIRNRFEYRGDIHTIDEFQGLDLKTELILDSCYELYSLEGFKDIFPQLKRLSIRNCPNIADLSPLLESNITNLQISEDLAYLISDEFAEKALKLK